MNTMLYSMRQNNKLKLILAGLVLFAANETYAQADMGSPTAVSKGGAVTATIQNWDCIGINPANLGFEDNFNFSLGTTNYALNVQSSAINYKDLWRLVSDPSKQFTDEQKRKYAKSFSSPDGVNFQANANWLMFSVWFPKLGGIGFSMRDRINGHMSLNSNASDILFNGIYSKAYQDTNLLKKPISTLLDSTRVSYFHYREFNLNYGRKIFGSPEGLQMFAGVGVKYLYGIADMDFEVKGNSVNGRMAFSKDYSFNHRYVEGYQPVNSDYLFNTVGNGLGFDAGITLRYKEMFSLGASVVDMGTINWSKNTLVTVDSALPVLPAAQDSGLQNFDPNMVGGFIYNSITSMVKISEGPGYKTQLPGKFRVGLGFRYSRLTLSADMIMPLNKVDGTLDDKFFAFGAEVRVAKSAKIGAGVAGNKTYGVAVPFGFTLGAMGITEFYIATNDLVSFFDKGKKPQFSIAIGLFRYNWMNHTTKAPLLAE